MEEKIKLQVVDKDGAESVMTPQDFNRYGGFGFLMYMLDNGLFKSVTFTSNTSRDKDA